MPREMKYKFILISTFFQTILFLLFSKNLSIIESIFAGIGIWFVLMLFFGIVEFILRIDILCKIVLFFYKLFVILSVIFFFFAISDGKEGIIVWGALFLFLYTFFKLADMEINHSDPWEFIPFFNKKKSATVPTSFIYTMLTSYTPPPKKRRKKTKKNTKKTKKNIVKCINCGKEIENPTSNICPYCGKDIYNKQIDLIKCPNCGQEYSSDEAFCPFCGKPKP